jgi:hypothetical protein
MKEMLKRLMVNRCHWAIARRDYRQGSAACVGLGGALCEWTLLVALAFIQIGCNQQAHNRIVPTENPTPLPDSAMQMEAGEEVESPASRQQLERSEQVKQ